MDAKVMKEMLEGNSGLRSEFTSVSAYYDSRTYSATFSFHPILLLVRVSVSYQSDSPFHAVVGEGTKKVYCIETGTPFLLMTRVSWGDTTISFKVDGNSDRMFYFWGIG